MGVKGLRCRFCREAGTLNRHGRLKGQAGEVRGSRFWCCPRRKTRPGCGRTFSIWLGRVLPRHSVSAAVLSRFLIAWGESGGNVLAAWERARTGFSTDSAYRWIKRFQLNQDEVRTRLCRVRAPPPTRGAGTLADLFEHLSLVLGSDNFTEAFQIGFQRPWPMRLLTGI